MPWGGPFCGRMCRPRVLRTCVRGGVCSGGSQGVEAAAPRVLPFAVASAFLFVVLCFSVISSLVFLLSPVMFSSCFQWFFFLAAPPRLPLPPLLCSSLARRIRSPFESTSEPPHPTPHGTVQRRAAAPTTTTTTVTTTTTTTAATTIPNTSASNYILPSTSGYRRRQGPSAAPPFPQPPLPLAPKSDRERDRERDREINKQVGTRGR